VISLTFAKLSLETDEGVKSVCIDREQGGAIELLRKMAFLHTDGIPADLFKDEEWVHVSTLARHSLVLDIEGGGLSMHAMTQEVVRDLLMGSSKATALGGVLAALHVEMAEFDHDKPATYFVGRQFARHVRAAAPHMQPGEVGLTTETKLAVANLCNKTAVFFAAVACSLQEALVLYRKSLDLSIKVHGEEHPDVATSYNNIASLFQSQGKYPEALELHTKSLAIDLKLHGPEHPGVARSYNNMACVYFKSQGKEKEAMEFFEKSLAINLKFFGPEHPEVLGLYNNMAAVFFSQGKYEESMELRKTSLAMGIKALGAEHPVVADAYDGMAGVYLAQFQLAEALEVMYKSLAIKVKVYGPEDPRVAELRSLLTTIESVGRSEEEGGGDDGAEP
ncbi:hypothetical protein T484DRAFT_1982955, partial [Baffinella frigidus]